MSDIRVSRHALERWRERVHPGCTEAEALHALAAMAAGGRRTEKPPRWLGKPGNRGRVVFVTWQARFPGVALVVRDDWIRTVLTREMGRRHIEVQKHLRTQGRQWNRRRRRVS